MQRAKYQNAFTLIELLLVMVIIGILAVSAFSVSYTHLTLPTTPYV